MDVIGIDLGGTKLAGALLTEEGQIIEERALLLKSQTGLEVGNLVCQMVSDLLEIADHAGTEISAAGISVPGISHQDAGTVWAPNLPDWEAFPLRDEIRTRLGAKLPALSIESDRTCSILGEQWLGAARGCPNVIFLTVGTGIGAGILVDGHILRGHQDVAGAVGWMALSPAYRSEYQSWGCFEHHASGNGIARLAQEKLQANPEYRGMLHSCPPHGIRAEDVFHAYQLKDPIAEAVLQEAVRFWGMAVANLVSLFNPEKIIFGGGVFGPAAVLLPDIRAEALLWAQPVSMAQVVLEPSQLGPRAPLIGAAASALNIHRTDFKWRN
jgi:glucokinase